MTGMAVLLLVRPILCHRDGFAQTDERGAGWSADGEHRDRTREHPGSNAGLLLAITLARRGDIGATSPDSACPGHIGSNSQPSLLSVWEANDRPREIVE